jgi:hypothetical protein
MRAPQVVIAQKVVQGIYPGVTTTELDELAAQTGERARNSNAEHLQSAGNAVPVAAVVTSRVAFAIFANVWALTQSAPVVGAALRCFACCDV